MITKVIRFLNEVIVAWYVSGEQIKIKNNEIVCRYHKPMSEWDEIALIMLSRHIS